jgi:hypothetical protein
MKPDQLVHRILEAETRALASGDLDTLSTLSDCITYVVNTEVHGSHYWATAEQVVRHGRDRLAAMFAAQERAK